MTRHHLLLAVFSTLLFLTLKSNGFLFKPPSCPEKRTVDYGPEIGTVDSISSEKNPDCYDFVPESLRKIDTHFYLSTKRTRKFRMDYTNNGSVDSLNFDPRKNTFFLFHGWTQSGSDQIYRQMKDALLSEEDCNVIIADYHKGVSITVNHYQAIVNGFVAGKVAFRLIELLRDRRGLDMKRLRLIGMSLGGQMAGLIGRLAIKKFSSPIAVIYANDPSGTWYGAHPEASLTKNDADFVSVIHTNIANNKGFPDFGLRDPAGHVDFYVNGGRRQPACLRQNIPELAENRVIACNHLIANDYFVASISNKECFTSYPCPSVLTTESSVQWNLQCNSCDGNNCGKMGFYSQQAPGRGVQYLTVKLYPRKKTLLAPVVEFAKRKLLKRCTLTNF